MSAITLLYGPKAIPIFIESEHYSSELTFAMPVYTGHQIAKMNSLEDDVKLLKYALWLMIAIVTLIICAVVIIPQVIDPNDYRDAITRTIKEHTGRDLAIKGHLSLSVFPWFGIQAAGLHIAQPQGVGTGDMLVAANTEIKVKLLPLLKKEVNVATIVLNQPKLHIITTQSGLTSFDSTTPKSSKQQQPEQQPAANTPDTVTSGIAALTIQGLQIIDGELLWDDQQSNVQHHIQQLNITTGNLLGDRPAPIEGSVLLALDKQPPTTLTLTGNSQFHLNDLSLTGDNIRLQLTQELLSITTVINEITFSQQQQSANLAGINTTVDLPQGPINIKVPTIDVDLQREKINIETLGIDFLNTTVNSSIMLGDWGNILTYKGQFASNSFNPSQFVKALGLDYNPSEQSVFQKAALSGVFSGSAHGLSLQKIKWTLDKSELNGNIAIMNFEDPKYRFDLSLNTLNLDHYLPTANTTTADGERQSVSTTGGAAIVVPMAVFKSIQANGIFRAKQLTANNVTVSDMVLPITSSKRKVAMTPTANLYGGRITGNLIFTDNNGEYTLTIDKKATSVALEPLLTDAGISDQLSGRGTVNVNVKITEKQGQQTQQGTVKVVAKDGLIKGLNIKKILDETQDRYDKFRGKPIKSTTTSTEDQTAFTEMSTTLLLNNSVITSDDLSIKAPAFRIGGEGKIDLAKNKINYTTLIKAVGTNKGQSGADADTLRGLTIPVRFLGSIEQPEYKVDWNRFLKLNYLDRKKDKLMEKINKKLGLTAPTQDVDEGQPAETPEDAAKEKLQKELQRGIDRLFR